MGNDVAKSSHIKTVKKIRGDRKQVKENKAENSPPVEKGAARVKVDEKNGNRAPEKPGKNALRPGLFIQHTSANFSDKYTGVRVLGKGSFGEVILCRDKTTNLECAVKVISKSSIKKGVNPTALLREIELLKELDHPNIIKLYEFMEDAGYFYLVTELYTGGELFDKIVKNKRLDIVDAARTMKQILSGINYMHHNSIVHRDIKPENLLLENEEPDAMIKIIDFGLSTFCVSNAKMKDKIGTAYYIAPEVLNGSYTEKCDIWSAGVILYILITGRPPFNGSTETSILSRVAAGQYSTRYIFDCVKSHREAQCVESLIRHMLTFVPSLRYTAQQCLDHEFITRLCSGEVLLPKEFSALEFAMDNVIRFQASQKLAKAALLYMGSKLTSKEETRHLTRIFERLDRNGDGQLDIAELKTGYKELLQLKGVDASKMDKEAVEAEVNTIFETIDFDKNGSLSYSEFITVCMDQKILLSKTRMERAFRMFDRDNNGKISSKELFDIFSLAGYNTTECDSMIEVIDSNKDGEIDFPEFEDMILRLLNIEEVSNSVKEPIGNTAIKV